MKAGFARKFITILAGMINAIIMPAQDIPIMPHDPAVKCVVLPDGLTCYVAVNQSSKGFADFALVNRDYSGNDRVCLLEDVAVGLETVLDSTLIRLMRKVAEDKMPADQAVIISGDVDASSVLTKLRHMSFMIDSSERSPSPEYVWDGESKVKASCVADSLKGLSFVSFEWEAPRAPASYMNTVQSVLYDKTTWEFGNVACRNIRRSLRKQDVPVAEVSYSRSDYTGGCSHEKHRVEVVVDEADAGTARNMAVSVLAALDRGEARADDVSIAYADYLLFLERSAADPVVDNSRYVKMCRDAFLYNFPLAREKERHALLMSKDVSEEVRTDMFSRIVSSLLDVDLEYDALEVPGEKIMLSDTLSLPDLSSKNKVRGSRKDAFSGGNMWTFANGVKVIYKKMPTGRKLYYSLSLDGGFGNIEDLRRGEGECMSDYLDCCWIAGMKGSYFKNLLKLSGMTMDTHVNMFNTVISGKVEDRNATLLMKALLAVANMRSLDDAESGYYVRSENLRRRMLAGSDVRAFVDNIMCPDFIYTSCKTGDVLGDDVFVKADKLFADLTSGMNDGVLVIVGDMDEDKLRKLLQASVGGFKVKKSASRRPSMPYHPVSGWSSYSVEGQKDMAVMAVSGRLPMTAANHFASEMAAMILERKANEVLSGSGLEVRLSYSRAIYPDERFSVMLYMSGSCAREDMAKLRDVLSDCAMNVDASDLASCKAYMKNAYALRMNTPDYWLRVIPLRHLEGKDFTTGYASKIDAVSADQVKAVFKVLEDGAGVEYIINKHNTTCITEQ